MLNTTTSSHYMSRTSISDTYLLASKVKSKLTREAVKSDVNLHRLVCQANLLDNLIDRLNSDSGSSSSEDESKASKISFESIASPKDGRQVKVIEPSKPLKSKGIVHEEDVEDFYDSDESDFDSEESDDSEEDGHYYYYEEVSGSDSEDEDEFEPVIRPSHPQFMPSSRNSSTYTPVTEVDDDDDDYLSISDDELEESDITDSLRRVSSNSNLVYNHNISRSTVDLGSHFLITEREIDTDSEEEDDEYDNEEIEGDNHDLPSLTTCSSISSNEDNAFSHHDSHSPSEVLFDMGDASYFKDFNSRTISDVSDVRVPLQATC